MPARYKVSSENTRTEDSPQLLEACDLQHCFHWWLNVVTFKLLALYIIVLYF